jgi:hypothetical protein
LRRRAESVLAARKRCGSRHDVEDSQCAAYRKGSVERFYRTHATDVHRAALVVYLSKCALRYLSKYTLS